MKTGEMIMPNYTVLITEDNPKNRKVFKDILRVHGYKSIEAVDGEEGYKMAKGFLARLFNCLNLCITSGFLASQHSK